MHRLKYYLQKKKYLFLFLSILIIFGIITGLYLGITNIEFLKEDISYYAMNIKNQDYNFLLIHFFLLVISLATSFIGLGVPILCTLIFYEGLTTGFLIGIFSITNGIGGCLFSLIFILITKVIYILLLLFFFLKCLEIARKMIAHFIYKKEIPSILVSISKASILLILFIFINDLIVLAIGNKILPIFGFLIL